MKSTLFVFTMISLSFSAFSAEPCDCEEAKITTPAIVKSICEKVKIDISQNFKKLNDSADNQLAETGIDKLIEEAKLIDKERELKYKEMEKARKELDAAVAAQDFLKANDLKIKHQEAQKATWPLSDKASQQAKLINDKATSNGIKTINDSSGLYGVYGMIFNEAIPKEDQVSVNKLTPYTMRVRKSYSGETFYEFLYNIRGYEEYIPAKRFIDDVLKENDCQ